MNEGYRKYRALRPSICRTGRGRKKALKSAHLVQRGPAGRTRPWLPHESGAEGGVLPHAYGSGLQEIEVGFPASSETGVRPFAHPHRGGAHPEDVTIQVLVQAREHLIRRTFQAIRGAKKCHRPLLQLHPPPPPAEGGLQTGHAGGHRHRRGGARLIRSLTEELLQDQPETHIRYEYSPSFSGTEVENAVLICDQVLEALGASPGKQSHHQPAQHGGAVHPPTPMPTRWNICLPQSAPPGQRRHQHPPPQRPGNGHCRHRAGADGRGPAGGGHPLWQRGSAPATWTSWCWP